MLAPKSDSTRRTATIVANTACRLYELKRHDFDAILSWHPTFATELTSKHDYVFEQNSTSLSKKGTLLFDGCSKAVKQMLVSCLRKVKVKANSLVMMQGEEADYIGFIIRGTAQVFVNGEHLGFMKSGDIIGQASILTSNQKRSATIRSSTELQLYNLGKEQFHSIVRWHPEFRIWVSKHALSYKHRNNFANDEAPKMSARNRFKSISSNIGELSTRRKLSRARAGGGL